MISAASRRWRLDCETLEQRLVLANIAITDAYLVTGSGTMPAPNPVIGQEVAVRVEWTTTNLPASIADYQIEFRVDGVPLRSADDNFGAGLSSGTYWWYQLGWYATPGPHTVEVVIDVDNEVVENNDADNSLSFGFTPTSANFPQRMIWPLETAPQTEGFWTNYNDVDPTGGVADYRGGAATYNGHNAIDAGPPTFVGQDRGVGIFAAADGVVLAINDGEFDRHTTFNQDPANYVIVDHGDGWESWYWHMRRDSVQVEVGQSVMQGDRLGLVGSSGSSTGAHIHFELRYQGLPVETYYEANTFWTSPVDYVGDNVYLIDAGVTNYDPGPHFWEGPSFIEELAQQSGLLTYASVYYSGLRGGDLVEFVWVRPSGSTFTTRSFTISQDYSSSGWYWGVFLPAVPDLGTWRLDYRVNGDLKGQRQFDITAAGAPEIRVEEPTGTIVVDERFTPIDYGTVALGTPSPVKSFQVINHGDAALDLNSLEVPTGYVVTNGLVPDLAPGASDTLTVALDTSVPGYFGGEIRIGNSDTDEGLYNFAIEGMVTSAGSQNLILGIGEFTALEGTQMVANVRRTGNISSPLTVSLAAGDPSEISLPPTVQFTAGADYTQFFFTADNDAMLDGTQRVELVATAPGYHDARKSVDVIDGSLLVDGDFNDDLIYDCADIDALIAEIASGTNAAAFDLSGDGLVNTTDRDLWLAEAGAVNLGAGKAYLLGDATLDGVVDGQDFIAWNDHKFTQSAHWCDGDFTADGIVDGQDFVVWNNHKFQVSDQLEFADSTRFEPLAGRQRTSIEATVAAVDEQMTESPIVATPGGSGYPQPGQRPYSPGENDGRLWIDVLPAPVDRYAPTLVSIGKESGVLPLSASDVCQATFRICHGQRMGGCQSVRLEADPDRVAAIE